MCVSMLGARLGAATRFPRLGVTGPFAPRRLSRLSPCQTPSGGSWPPATETGKVLLHQGHLCGGKVDTPLGHRQRAASVQKFSSNVKEVGKLTPGPLWKEIKAFTPSVSQKRLHPPPGTHGFYRAWDGAALHSAPCPGSGAGSGGRPPKVGHVPDGRGRKHLRQR